jgi:hypothetical protein
MARRLIFTAKCAFDLATVLVFQPLCSQKGVDYETKHSWFLIALFGISVLSPRMLPAKIILDCALL